LEEDLCRYKPDRGLDYYASGLAGILRVVVGPGRTSTHAYIKEVRDALQALVFSAWDRADELIPIIAESNIPDEAYSSGVRACFRGLLEGLLKRFKEDTDAVPMGARIKLMNMTLRAITEMASGGKLPPVGEKIVSAIFSSKSNPSSNNPLQEVRESGVA